MEQVFVNFEKLLCFIDYQSTLVIGALLKSFLIQRHEMPLLLALRFYWRYLNHELTNSFLSFSQTNQGSYHTYLEAYQINCNPKSQSSILKSKSCNYILLQSNYFIHIVSNKCNNASKVSKECNYKSLSKKVSVQIQ